MKTDNLSDLGQVYQSKVILNLIIDKEFLESADDILYPDYFESEANQWIIKTIKNYYSVYKTNPTAEVFKKELDKETDENFKEEIIKKLKEASDYSDATDLKYIKDTFIEFCINQHYKISIYKAVDLLEDKKYDDIRKMFDDASKVGQNKHLGLNLLRQDVKEVFEKMKRNCIPTPWDVINDITDGGSAGGELHIAVGGPGGGKTWTLCSVGAAAVKAGLRVNHYTLELSEIMVAKRYYSIMTGIPSHDLPYSIDEIEKRITALSNKGGEFLITEYPTKGASINTLRSHISKCINFGMKPDLVIVDYGDLLRAPKFYKDKRLEIGNIFEELRGLAGEFKVPVWTASQANRCHHINDIVITENGPINIGNINVGDKILTHKGYKLVKYKSDIIKQPIYEIKLKSGKYIRVSAEHKFPTQYNQIKSISTGLNIGDKLFTKKS